MGRVLLEQATVRQNRKEEVEEGIFGFVECG